MEHMTYFVKEFVRTWFSQKENAIQTLDCMSLNPIYFIRS